MAGFVARIVVLLGVCGLAGGCAGDRKPTPQESQSVEDSIQKMQEQAYGKSGEPPSPPKQ